MSVVVCCAVHCLTHVEFRDGIGSMFLSLVVIIPWLLTSTGARSLKSRRHARPNVTHFVLQPLNTSVSSHGSGLMSFTKNIFSSYAAKTVTNGAETYNALVENDFVNTKQASETGLSLNINCASYSNIRRFLNMKNPVPPDGVRIEEMLNYFDLNTIANNAANNTAFLCQTQLTSCPWDAKNQLLFIRLLAPKLDLHAIPPAHLTFLIDVSGSMDKDNRLPLVQHALRYSASVPCPGKFWFNSSCARGDLTIGGIVQ